MGSYEQSSKKLAFVTECFHGLISQKIMSNVAFMFEETVISRGELLTISGQECNKMYIVEKGEVGIVMPNSSGVETAHIYNLQAIDFVRLINP